MFRKVKPAPETDLQSRLCYIQGEAKRIKTDTDSEDVRRLVYLVEYLAAIVEKHLREGEK